MKTVDEQVALAERLGVVLRLLRDAGAEDVAARISVEAGEAIYHGLVHSIQDAAARWRVQQRRPQPGRAMSVPAHVRLHACALRAVKRVDRRVSQSLVDRDHECALRLAGEALDLALRLRERAATALLQATRPPE